MIKINLLNRLLSSDSYITSKELAQELKCSVRTIKTNMDYVEAICQEHKISFIRKKGKGYLIDENSEVKSKLSKLYEQSHFSQSTDKERMLILLFILILEPENKLTITELSEIFFLSRPSIYKGIKEINGFLESYDSEIINTRSEGLQLQAGEKRKRLLLTKCLDLCNDLFDQEDSYDDRFKFSEYINQIIKQSDKRFIKNLILRIKEECGLDFSLHELNWLIEIFSISIQRSNSGNEVTIPQTRQELIKQIDNKKTVKLIMDEVTSYTGVTFSEQEAIYIYTLLVVQSSEMPIKHTEISRKLSKEIKEYIMGTVNLADEDYNLLTDTAIGFLVKEVHYQINNHYYSIVIDYYRKLEASFGLSAVMAKKICELSNEYYSIRMTEQLLCNLIFSISNVFEKNKRQLKTVLLHDCNEIELIYIKTKLDKYINFIKIVDETFELKDITDCDLIISTIDVSRDDFSVIRFSKNMNHLELNLLFSKCNQLYQMSNYKRIVKNFDNFPQILCK
ncbi:HTH domain-containing protein [Acidaminobacter sp. JC074]|uniref:BglG family transcription antiterminator n=1 Tax=Acidaminobacter sp. JC074 TaxID=2530199 RepID=UPI001F0EA600|nr:HTH domain-containing protein [Acidaminobacter sp. JC074]